MRCRGWWLIGLIFIWASNSNRAQVRWGEISGRVLDPAGAVIPAASVQLWEQEKGVHRMVQTDPSGTFRFERLSPGHYHIQVSAEGFATQSRDLTLTSGAHPHVEFALSTQPLVEEVAVLASSIVDTPEVLTRVPGSVEILDRRALDASRVFTVNEALRKVTGVFARDEEGFSLRPNIGIRGLNPTRSTKVLLLEDGIPLTYAPYGDNASYYHPPVDRFESIEVIKGSGQILYGPMTIGGVINYITPNPPEKPRGALTLIGGNRDYLNGHLTYGGTWGGTGLLFDYMRKQGEGARENTRTGLNDANVKIVTALGSRHALTIKGNYYGENSQVTYSGLRLDEYLANPRQNPFLNDRFLGDRYGASVTHAYVLKNDVVLTTSLYGSMFFRDWWRQSSNSGQRPNRRGDPGCRGMEDLLTTCGNEGRLRKYYTWGIEPRVRAFDRILGIRGETEFGFRAHFERQDRKQMNGQAPTARTGIIVEDNERKNQAYSGFLQHRFLLGRWTITPGLRLEHVRYERTNRLANRGAGAAGRTHLTEVIPGIGITFAPASHTTIFGGAHRGFAPPRTEDIIDNAGGTIDLDPERSWTYEVGVRSWPISGLKLEATFFRMDFENQIVPASVAGGLGATFTNAGETLHQGMEFTGRVDMGSLLRMTHNVYARAAYTYVPTAKFVGTRLSSIPGFGTVSVSGNRLPYAPKHLANLQFGYAHPRGFDAFLEAVHVSDQFGDDLNTIAPTPDGQRGLLPAYTIWNLTMNYRVESRGLTFFVAVKNLFDRLYIADRTRGILPGPPRLVHGGLRFQF
ncbi:MAG TPA: TonB-dependent receptor [Blastocatellia bacterium]|nr:TonB-dependent receptor [Blastocatellia bacterium]